MVKEKHKLIFICIDSSFFLLFIALFIGAILNEKVMVIGAPVFFIVNGFAMIVSNKLKKMLFYETILYWVSYNIFVPRLKNNHIIWGCFSLILGIFLAFFDFNDSFNDSQSLNEFENWWYKDPVFWIVSGLLIIISIFRYKNKPKKDFNEKNSNKN